MKLRQALAASVGAVGFAALGNKLLLGAAGTLAPALRGDHQVYRWRGMDVAYTEAGDPDDPDVLLLHGIHAAASSQEFEAIFESLAADHHVIAPDLPGFGRSDRPPLSYSASLYATFISAFARDVTDDPICVASSLTGSFAAVAARDDRFSRLVLICPTGRTAPESRAIRALFRSPLVGTTLFNILVSRYSLRWFNERDAYGDPAAIPDEEIEYQWLTAHQPGARFAPAAFVSGALNPDQDLARILESVDVPVTLIWGRDADIVPLEDGKALAEQTDNRLIVFDDTKLLPHVEHPRQFLDVLHRELPRMQY